MSSTQDRSVSGMVDGPNRAVTTLLPLSTVLAIAVEKVYGKGSFPGAFLQIPKLSQKKHFFDQAYRHGVL